MATQNENTKISYFNTLIFTIIAGIISLLLLLSLFSDKVKNMAFYFIIAVEVGIFSVVAICIYQIISNEAKLNAKKKNLDAKIAFTECPDYFIKYDEDSETYCANNYTVTDGAGNKMIMRIYPSDTNLPDLPAIIQDKNEKFNLYQLQQSPDLTNAKQQCAPIFQEPNIAAATNPAQAEQLRQYVGYSKLPWSHARTRCAPYVTN